MTKEMKELWAAEIGVHIKNRFGLSVIEVVPIDKGWLNIKWKMVTDHGPLFVKYYHPQRYQLYTRPERRSTIEKTLQLQNGLSVSDCMISDTVQRHCLLKMVLT